MSFLDPLELLIASEVSRHWFILASSDHLWDTLLLLRTRRSCHTNPGDASTVTVIPLSTLAQHAGSKKGFKKIAFFIEISESKRQFITLDDLCGQASWNFRFKDAAGENWTDICPWHRGLPAGKVSTVRKYYLLLFNSQ